MVSLSVLAPLQREVKQPLIEVRGLHSLVLVKICFKSNYTMYYVYYNLIIIGLVQNNCSSPCGSDGYHHLGYQSI